MISMGWGVFRCILKRQLLVSRDGQWERNKETGGSRGKIKRERNCVFYSLLCTQYIMSLHRRRVNDLMNWSWEWNERIEKEPRAWKKRWREKREEGKKRWEGMYVCISWYNMVHDGHWWHGQDILYVHWLIILYSHCTHTVLTLINHTVPTLYSCCTRTLLILHSHCTHTALVLYSYCTHTVLILHYSSSNTQVASVLLWSAS